MLQVERSTAIHDTLRHAHETPLGFDVPSHYVGTRFPATEGNSETTIRMAPLQPSPYQR